MSPCFQIRKEINDMKNLLRRLWRDEEGQDLIEYALLVALVALAAVTGMQGLANAINTEFLALGSSMQTLTT
jgi:pilus assembly protein Flp/PilA